MNLGPRNAERGASAARQFGAEYAANPGSSRREYLDAAAFCFREDAETYQDLTPEEKQKCSEQFQEGVRAERALQ